MLGGQLRRGGGDGGHGRGGAVVDPQRQRAEAVEAVSGDAPPLLVVAVRRRHVGRHLGAGAVREQPGGDLRGGHLEADDEHGAVVAGGVGGGGEQQARLAHPGARSDDVQLARAHLHHRVEGPDAPADAGAARVVLPGGEQVVHHVRHATRASTPWACETSDRGGGRQHGRLAVLGEPSDVGDLAARGDHRPTDRQIDDPAGVAAGVGGGGRLGLPAQQIVEAAVVELAGHGDHIDRVAAAGDLGHRLPRPRAGRRVEVAGGEALGGGGGEGLAAQQARPDEGLLGVQVMRRGAPLLGAHDDRLLWE